MSSPAPFAPTHRVPDSGLAAYETPDSQAQVARLDPRLSVQVVDRAGARVRIVCDNGWSAWIDGDFLVPVMDTAPVWAAVEGALATMRQLLADFEAGRIDEPTYRAKTFQAGLIVNNGHAWMVDLVNQRVHRYDGFQLRSLDLVTRPEA
jgi:hypothetical protein